MVLILVGTIIVVVIAVRGGFSSTVAPNDDEAIKKVVKAIEDAMSNAGDDKEYMGGVYIKIQEQWLDDKGQKTQEKSKSTHIVLKEVTVYGAKEAWIKNVKALAVQVLILSESVAVIMAQKFESGAIKKDEAYPVITALLDKFKLEATKDDKSEAEHLREEGVSKGDMWYYQKIAKK